MFASTNSHHSGSGYGGSANDQNQRKKGKREALQRENRTWMVWQKELEAFLRRVSGKAGIKYDSDVIPVLNTLKQVLRCQAPDWWWKRPQRKVYALARDVSRVLTEDHPKAWGDPEDMESPMAALESLAETSKALVSTASSTTGGHAETNAAESIATHNLLTAQLGNIKEKGNPTDDKDLSLPRAFLQLREKASAVAKAFIERPECSMMSGHDYYRQKMRPLAFAMVEEATFENPKHFYAPGGGCKRNRFEFTTTTSSKSQLENTTVLWKEISTYPTALPIEYGSSIFVRALECELDKLRVLIIGPEDTPYANGCFLFDVTMGNDYPNKPPKVQFLTTTDFLSPYNTSPVRFNPNLYADGKVCLSLLGTWSGPSWSPKESTLLQVLVSLQSLILGAPHPYYNEPGYEKLEGTQRGNAQSVSYNKTIRRQTLKVAILPFMRNQLQGHSEPDCSAAPFSSGPNSTTTHSKRKASPTTKMNPRTTPYFSEFKDVIHEHFRLKKRSMRKQLFQWFQEDRNEFGTLYSDFCKVSEQLENFEKQSSAAKRSKLTASLDLSPVSFPKVKMKDGVIVLDGDEMEKDSGKQSQGNGLGSLLQHHRVGGKTGADAIELLKSDDEDDKPMDRKMSAGVIEILDSDDEEIEQIYREPTAVKKNKSSGKTTP